MFECTSSIARLLAGPIVSVIRWEHNKSAEKLAFEIFALYVFLRREMVNVVGIVLQHVHTSESIVCTFTKWIARVHFHRDGHLTELGGRREGSGTHAFPRRVTRSTLFSLRSAEVITISQHASLCLPPVNAD